ncbi:helix-turn-helix domain-containing protein [Mucilaginibacter sp. FT3.2]|uniref:helix-turn-helix domain-containing protein n=1 Tax=Mucilaginibacter sp. FT3.2 TaxID=2723090 RepID=UPI0017B73873|nr:helix-turn-helix domain containing protein [Mucilaginibacter sp. FT3.2]MBB6234584.1 lambda repressor-like predicted transcriptional regulator [Mucilaginibacter sp. FT3.2]
MDIHHGKIIELVIRREGYSISELARLAKVNRRSVYYWFNQQYLKTELIYQVGIYIKHDFSVEFPHLFKTEDFSQMSPQAGLRSDKAPPPDQHGSEYWKDKYLDILEKYNLLLTKIAERYTAEIESEIDKDLPRAGLKTNS